MDLLSRVVEERCNNKLVVVLSRHYNNSAACRFLTHFARDLDPDSRRRNIVPVLIDHIPPTDIPHEVRGIALIRYNHAFRCGWLKKKLVEAISA